MQTKFTRLPSLHERKFHYKGPGTQCWDRSKLNEPDDHCGNCIWMVQTCRVISQLPVEKLDQLELEGKIKNRVRLQPREKVKAPFPTHWQQIGALQCRLWTPEARMPKIVQDGYLLYTNQDIHLQGSTMVPTGVDLKLPPNVIGLLVPCNPNSNYVVNMLHISSEQRISVHV